MADNSVNQFNHLEIEREPDSFTRRTWSLGEGAPSAPNRANRNQHGQRIKASVQTVFQSIVNNRQSAGIDSKSLIVIEFNTLGIDITEELEARFGASVVEVTRRKEQTQEGSQEYYSTIVQFPDEHTINSFIDEIGLYQSGNEITGVFPPGGRKKFYDSIENIRTISEEDRKGKRLKNEDVPDDYFLLDIDIWKPQFNQDAIEIENNLKFIVEPLGGQITDRVKTESLLLFRVKANQEILTSLLIQDYIAKIDLPGIIQEEFSVFTLDISSPIDHNVPSEDAPMIGIIDSGVQSAHPFLENWVIEALDYSFSDNSEVDTVGHGNAVSGFAVYGNIREAIEANNLIPKVAILSGKILEKHPHLNQPVFSQDHNLRIEHVIEEVISTFVNDHGCKIFNLSINVLEDVYNGGRQFPLAEKLDELSKDLDILIFISTGNVSNPIIPVTATTRDQLFELLKNNMLESEHRLLNPATSSLAITVGSISKSGETSEQDSIVATASGAPSCFSRIGPGVSGWKKLSEGEIVEKNSAIKPEFVAYAGNFSLQGIAGTSSWIKNDRKLGEPSLKLLTEDESRPFTLVNGTSYAAPQIAHIAAILNKRLESMFGEEPSANLIKSILGVGVDEVPCGLNWFPGNSTSEKEENMLKMTGYGTVNMENIEYSLINRINLIAQDEIEEDKIHYYDVSIPDEFINTSGRKGITVSLAYDPPVKASRKEYLARTIELDVLHGLTGREIERYRARLEDTDLEQSLTNRNVLNLKPSKKKVEWSTLQVRKKIWKSSNSSSIKTPDNGDFPKFHIVLKCQNRFEHSVSNFQNYALTVNLWHESTEVNIYQHAQNYLRLTQRARARLRA